MACFPDRRRAQRDITIVMSQDRQPTPSELSHGTRTITVPAPTGAPGGTLLVVVEGPTPGQAYPLRANTCTIGRHQGCTVVLSSITVSRQHATITRQGNLFYVVDNQSSNGVYLNGQKVPSGQNCPLRSGDMLRLGEFLLLFKHDEKAATPLGLSTIKLDTSKIRREVDDFLKEVPTSPPGNDAPTAPPT
jgi:pSer/pThr/pTyr-binding forkhead associated (FHA) protein